MDHDYLAGNEDINEPDYEASEVLDSTQEDEFDEQDILENEEDQNGCEYIGQEEILGPDPETGEPRVEILMDPLISRANEAAHFLKGILIRMGLSGRIAATIRQGSIYLEIAGAEPGLVIGHRGQNLDALQHLVNRMVNRKSEDMIPVTVDSDEYRNRRNQQLEVMVKSIGREVLSTGEVSTTEPLTPSERRLFHIAAGQIRGIRTESFGEGFFQPIRVIPNNQAANRYSSFHSSNRSDQYSKRSQVDDRIDSRSRFTPNYYPESPMMDNE